MWFPIHRNLDSATGSDLPAATNRDKLNQRMMLIRFERLGIYIFLGTTLASGGRPHFCTLGLMGSRHIFGSHS